jgi:hypothetical protein
VLLLFNNEIHNGISVGARELSVTTARPERDIIRHGDHSGQTSSDMSISMSYSHRVSDELTNLTIEYLAFYIINQNNGTDPRYKKLPIHGTNP